MQNARAYEIRIWYSPEPGDECYIAQVEDWPTITAVGETREEAAREIEVALKLAVASAHEAGIEPPTPRRLVRS